MPGELLVVEVDCRVESLNRLSKEVWQTRARRRQREFSATMAALKRHTPPPLPLIVRFVRLAPTLVDTDNLAIAFKVPRDAVAHWLGVSDGPREKRVSWLYDQELLRERLTFGLWGPRPKHKLACRFRIEIARHLTSDETDAADEQTSLSQPSLEVDPQ
jgi:hypothetical protein